MAFDVFISHSSKDKLTADAVCAVLEGRGIRCWVAPRDIQAGSDWGEAIIDAIRNCRVMVLVFSQHANASVQIKREVNRALHHGKPVLPLRIEHISPTGMLEYSLSTMHWLDAYTPPMDDHLNHLAETVKAILEGKPQVLPKPRPIPPSPNSWLVPGIITAVVLVILFTFLTLRPSPPAGNSGGGNSGGSGTSSSSASSASIKGKWILKQQGITAPGNSAFTELIAAALTGPDVKCELQVKELNEYSLSVTATDSGTVAPAPATSDNNKALSFTSKSTHKTQILSYLVQDNSNGAFNSLGVGTDEKALMFGINLGGGTVVTHGNPESSGDSGTIDPGLVGTWLGTPFNVNPPNGLWSGSLALHADGTYLLSVTHQERGIITINNDQLTAKPSTSASNGMPAPSLFNDSGSSATFRLSDNNTLEIGTTNGTLTFTRD